jgi:hypothetical protein
MDKELYIMKKLFIDMLSTFIKNPSKKKLIRNILTNKIDTKNNNNPNNILDITAKINQIANDTSNLKHFINRIVERKLSVAELHKKTFTPFKNKHQNQEIVVIGTGPTAKLYTPLKDAIHLGVNHSFLLKNVKLDYFFIQDFYEKKDMIKDINNYQGNNCIKFYGLTTEYEGGYNRVVPESDAILASALRYRTDWEQLEGFQSKFSYNITTQALGCFGSVIFPSLQFALYTNPKRIYIVGCDLTNNHFYDNKTLHNYYNKYYPTWQKFKEFAQIYYPSTEIVSINPVGLKGMFKDIYS